MIKFIRVFYGKFLGHERAKSFKVPRPVLARHYTDFNPERMREIYEKANLKIFEDYALGVIQAE